MSSCYIGWLAVSQNHHISYATNLNIEIEIENDSKYSQSIHADHNLVYYSQEQTFYIYIFNQFFERHD